MTASGHGARHHLLALPAEVRHLIIKKLISSPQCVIKDEEPKYTGACLPILRTCRTLRREAIFILGGSIEIKMRQSTIPRLRQSLPVGLWDHLQDITYLGDAPLLKHIEVFKHLKALRFLTWEPVEEPFGLGFDETFDLPESMEQNKWTIELGFFLLSFIISHFYFLNGKLFDEGVYEDLDLPFDFNLYLPVYAGVYHPDTGQPGLIDVVSSVVRIPLAY